MEFLEILDIQMSFHSCFWKKSFKNDEKWQKIGKQIMSQKCALKRPLCKGRWSWSAEATAVVTVQWKSGASNGKCVAFKVLIFFLVDDDFFFRTNLIKEGSCLWLLMTSVLGSHSFCLHFELTHVLWWKNPRIWFDEMTWSVICIKDKTCLFNMALLERFWRVLYSGGINFSNIAAKTKINKNKLILFKKKRKKYFFRAF